MQPESLMLTREQIAALPPSAGIEHIPTLLHLANALHHAAGKEESAGLYYRKILLLDPGNPDALHYLGLVEHAKGNNEHAILLIERALGIQADAQKWHNLGIVQEATGNIPAAVVAYRNSLRHDPFWLQAATNLIFSLDLYHASTPELLLAERRAFNARFCAADTANAAPYTHALDPNTRLKIGYISGDFTLHSASMAFSPFLHGHDHQKFDIFLYSNGAKPDDDMSRSFQNGRFTWSEVSGISDDQLVEIIRKDGIHILVDMSGFSAGARLPLFAKKPAPIQVTGWGYATGVGLDCMDYLVSDAVAVPPESEQYYHEKIVRLPAMFTYAPGQPIPDVGTLPVLKNGNLTFGYLGRALKLSDETVIAWGEILRQVPDAKLILKGDEYRQPFFRKRIMDLLVAQGVDERRVTLMVGTSRFDHLSTYNLVDIMLDPWPVGSGVTALDATLMGVPIVTKLGPLIPSRTAASVAAHVGLGDWKNESVRAYIDTAIAWSNDVPFLNECRTTLRKKLQDSIIMDGQSYARAWEKALRQMWRDYCAEKKQEKQS